MAASTIGQEPGAPGPAVQVVGAELRRVRLALVSPFRSAAGDQSHRDALLVRVVTTEGEGWGECVAMNEPRYTSEYTDGAEAVMNRFLLPALGAGLPGGAASVAAALAPFRGHPMAKSALEMAVLDAQLRAAGRSLASYLGAVRPRVPAGVSLGLAGSVPELLDAVADAVGSGYLRVKLKIQPGWDVVPVRAVRERFGEGLVLQVDANGAYTTADLGTLVELDDFGLAMIEQPLAPDALGDHAAVARRLRTPICLDESIGSARMAADAIAMGACRVVNVKPGRVGGLLEARRVHDVCVAAGVPAWCGGMLETGLGRAANLALAGLPGFTLPGDVSATERYFVPDITPPIVVEGGHLGIPDGPGLGVQLLSDVLEGVTVSSEWIPVSPRAPRPLTPDGVSPWR